MLSCRFILFESEGEKLTPTSDDVWEEPQSWRGEVPKVLSDLTVCSLGATTLHSPLLRTPPPAAAAEAEAAEAAAGFRELAAYAVIKADIVLVLAEVVDL